MDFIKQHVRAAGHNTLLQTAYKLGLGLALFSLGFSSGVAQAATYKLQILAQTGDTIGGQTLIAVAAPVINDLGTALFLASFSEETGLFSIQYSHRGGRQNSSLIAQTGDVIGDQTLCGFSNYSVNDTGTIAFESPSYSVAQNGCETTTSMAPHHPSTAGASIFV